MKINPRILTYCLMTLLVGIALFNGGIYYGRKHPEKSKTPVSTSKTTKASQPSQRPWVYRGEISEISATNLTIKLSAKQTKQIKLDNPPVTIDGKPGKFEDLHTGDIIVANGITAEDGTLNASAIRVPKPPTTSPKPIASPSATASPTATPKK